MENTISETKKNKIAHLSEKVSNRYKGRLAETVYFAVYDALILWEAKLREEKE